MSGVRATVSSGNMKRNSNQIGCLPKAVNKCMTFTNYKGIKRSNKQNRLLSSCHDIQLNTNEIENEVHPKMLEETPGTVDYFPACSVNIKMGLNFHFTFC
jgi:hypothetical protein